MVFCKNQMPRGMLLRSAWDASHIGDPTNALSLNAYQARLRAPIGKPVPLDKFIDYGLWFQSHAAPDLDTRHVARLQKATPGFTMHLEDSELLHADRVVIATGLAMLALRPLDVNPRVWGWHTLGQRAGVDFAHLQWRVSHGEPCPSVCARPSVRWARLTADVPTALREVAGGRLAAGRYLRSLRDPLECAVLSAADPLPALAEVPLAVYDAAARAIARRPGGPVSARRGPPPATS